ncbi:folate-binding protein YgfZ [Lysobacter arenosi]|uniref:Folate-binding protein YgfZ n=1 Tax=Lysobacter arenosi TaxID=2795387 RepID=A0ABX7RDJ3_9GAMM|nr:folate-binding protein YgfZ [Lysobacter arenosi]QSX76080.1 folate-binding protein YgfZ [Lysobacter arenosi]
MHDNPQAAAGLAFALPDHRLIALSGRDAVAFAQAQFMNDVGLLEPRSWQWNGWLTPKGRVVALFALLKLSDETLWLLLPDADPTELAAALQRFVFRSKVKIEVRQDLHVSGSFTAPAMSQGSALGGDDGVETVEMDVGGDAGPRCLRISGGADATADAQALARWQAYDLEHGLPRLPASQAGHWTPQQLSLERLQAFSVKKGCYPGQEIVARTHFLGQAKRGLALLEGDAALVAGSDVAAGATALGKLVAAVDADHRHVALAVLPLERETVEMTAGDVALRELPLRGGLGR